MATTDNAIPMTELEVTTLDAIAEGIYRLEFAHPEGDELPEFTPGAHLHVEAEWPGTTLLSVQRSRRAGPLRDRGQA